MEKTVIVAPKAANFRQRGVMDANYHTERLKSPGLKYRWKRRGWEAARVIKAYAPKHPRILDLGTADGLMLDYVASLTNPAFPAGLDLFWSLLQVNTRKHPILMADAEKIPFPSTYFDVVIATAIVEHVPHPAQFIEEIRRVLKPSGICIITTPVPVFEEVASHLGFLKEDDHQETFNLKKIAALVMSKNFELLEAEKFMMSPIGFPAEVGIEKVMKKIGLAPLLLNQLVAGRKT